MFLEGDTESNVIKALLKGAPGQRTLLHIDNADPLLARSGRHDPDTCSKCKELPLGAFIDRVVRESQTERSQLKVLLTACSNALESGSASAKALASVETLKKVRVLGLTVADTVLLAEKLCAELNIESALCPDCRCPAVPPCSAFGCKCDFSGCTERGVFHPNSELVYHQLLRVLHRYQLQYQGEQDSAYKVSGDRGLVEHRKGREQRPDFQPGKLEVESKVSGVSKLLKWFII
jgi:hypothetical protein